MTRARLAAALALAFLLALPLFADAAVVEAVMPAGLSGSALLHVFILIFFFAYLSQCWNILGGFTGQLSLGHAAFFGIGAYTSSLLYVDYGVSPWLGMLAGMGLAGLVGLVIGVVSFHYGLKGPFFTLVTIAFAEILRLLLLHVDWSGGPMGVLIPLGGDSLWDFQFRAKEPYYYIALAMMLLSIALVAWIGRSRMGFYFRAIRQDEDAAEAIGVDTWKYKLIAVTLSAGLTGAGGTFYAQYTQYVAPDDVVVVTLSVQILLATIIGGSGTVIGPILGAFLLIPIGEATRVIFEGGGTGVSLVSLLASELPAGEKLGQYLAYLAQGGGGGLAIILYGVVLMAVVLGMPGGILPWASRRFGSRAS
jgi:branched-chain amino acid transport system permease protein